MRILLTHGYFLEEDEKEKLIMKPYVPLGILYVAAYLEKNKYPNTFFDSTFSSFAKLKEEISSTRPDVIGIYTNLMTKLNVLRIISFIRSKEELRNCKVILGGPEVRHHAENFLDYGADIIVIGEGEETMFEVVKAIDEKRPVDDIPGIAFRKNGKVILTEERKLLKNIDELPFPARDKTDLNKYINAWKNAHGESSISVSTMRGCPYTCKWCSRAVYGGTYRRRSAKLVVDEIEFLQQNYSFDNIWFVDDVFTISHKWMKAFADEIAQRKIEVRYEIITRADRLNEEVMDQLAASGCFRIWIGAESGSQKIIDAMDRRVEVKQVREMIKLAKKKNIEAGTFIMLGYPGETEEDILETIEHLSDSQPDYFTLTIAYPIKGTPLYTETENSFIHPPDWANGTDRDIDFKRTHPKKYYEHAVRWVNNEVAYRKAKSSGRNISAVKFKLKAVVARRRMRSVER
ncbi:MAG TPA: radical SAM protein [Bacteroidia bacterium]|jgi:radical SAM superfamily enzyme YgiQ (UPF0313 family)|nr:radical SAM protein [Bacteroidia bacterium]